MKRLLLLIALMGASVRADAPAVVTMAPVRVSAAMFEINFKVGWEQNFSGQWVKSMWVRSVKPHSAAERAGLTKGMEILAIQGQDVRGLNQNEFGQLLQQFVTKEIVLKVQRSNQDPEIEIHIPAAQ